MSISQGNYYFDMRQEVNKGTTADTIAKTTDDNYSKNWFY